MVFKLATKLLAFLVAALQAEARRAAAVSDEFGRDIVDVEVQRVSLVAQANHRAAVVTRELAEAQQERSKQAAQATALAANLRLLTSLDKE